MLRSFLYQHVHSLKRGSYGRVEYRNLTLLELAQADSPPQYVLQGR